MLVRNLSFCLLVIAVALLVSADSCNSFSVSVTTNNFVVDGGNTATLTTSSKNGTNPVTYSWTLQQNSSSCSPGCGMLSATTGTTVTYTAPANPPAGGNTVTVAVNGTDASKNTSSATVTLTIKAALSVSVTPATFSFTPGAAPQSFTATVTNDTAQKGVTWSLSLSGADCTASDAPCGTISNATSTSVTYTPPASAAAAEQVVLTATPVSDTNITGSAILSISAGSTNPLTISVSPTTATATAGGSTISFSATLSGTGSSQGVTWGLFQSGTACPTGASSPCGSLSSTSANPVTYTPPSSASSTTTVTLTATAVTSSSVNASATITVQPQSVTGLFPRYLFEVNSDNTISSYAVVSSTGQLRPVTRVSAPPGAFEGAALNPVANVLYLVQPNNTTGGNATVSTFAITAAGQISQSGSNFNGNLDGGAGTIAVDPLGRYLYGTDSTDGKINLYTLDSSSGLPTLSTGTAISPNAKGLAVDSTGSFLYVEDTNSNLLGYQIGSNGALTSVGTAPSSHPMNGGGPIAVDPQGVYFVAVDNGSQPQLFAYGLSSGNLIPVSSSPFNLGAAGGAITEIAIDPTGTYLYAIDVANNQLIGIVNVNGVFTPITGSPFPVPSGVPKQLSVDPSGKYVYVAFENTQEVWAYSIASGGSAPGALTLVSKMRSRTSLSNAQLISGGPQPVTFTPQYLYVANSGTATIGQFSIAPATGALTSLGTPIAAGTMPYDVVADPNPSAPFVYTANQGSNNLSGFQIGSNGTLTALSNSPFSAGNTPEWVAMDLTGNFLFNVNSADATLSSFGINLNSGSTFGDPFSTTFGGATPGNPVYVSVDPTGDFAFTVNSPAGAANGSVTSFVLAGTFRSPATTPAGNLPGVGAFHPSGEYFYVANGDNSISEYSINASTGTLTSIGTVTVSPAGPASYNSVVIEPSGHFLYFSEQTANSIHIFSIDPSSGTLTATTSSAVGTGTAPYGLAVDISGTYLYVSNLNSSDISAFSIDPTSGNLTQVGTTTVSTGGTFPRDMTTTGTLH